MAMAEPALQALIMKGVAALGGADRRVRLVERRQADGARLVLQRRVLLAPLHVREIRLEARQDLVGSELWDDGIAPQRRLPLRRAYALHTDADKEREAA